MGRISTGVFALSLILAGSAPAAGQREQVGKIERILSLDGGARRTIREATPLVQVQQTGVPEWSDVAPGSPLFSGAEMRVERYLDARVRVESENHRGYIAFLPELWERGSGRVVRVGDAETRVREGRYSVTRSSDGARGVTVAIERGAVAIDWRSGELSLEAAGTGVLVYGTRLAVVVDSAGTVGRLFLVSGLVTLPQHPDFVVRSGRWIQLRPFPLPPIEEPLSAPEARLAREAVQYHASAAWSPGLLRPRNAFFAAGGVVVGRLLFDLIVSADEPGERSGTVTGRFPR